ncbi:serpulina hyodysenteriae variable surface protein [Brachyspira suanatina]|uniref:Serpulina hyodysenteriae variable surface protein n=1 Tax=Brachyspira suanatina TaxID=381802 RepID=A0A0G4KA05_9SPIR|nr:cell surface protein [Brachyspira suanatina]CRF35052.1 serpulina hyodysenteriae variable surface protein [Brachyspira suanatina]
MKKVLLTAMAILTVVSASAFGMYGRGDSWIDFLTHGNQFRARMDQLGFVLGNGTIKGTVGFRANTINLGNWGNILSDTGSGTSLNSTLSAGIGYTSDVFGIGVGYNFTYINKDIQVHTPVLTMNFLNNNLRLSIPIQVAVTDKQNGTKINNFKYTGVAFDNIQLRYYTGIDAFNAIRFYVYYRNNTVDTGSFKGVSESLGFQLRLYFLNTPVGNVTINPFVRIEYHTALKGSAAKNYTAEYSYKNNDFIDNNSKQSDIYDVSPYEFSIKPILGITANSDVVSLYVEPSLGYTLTGYQKKGIESTSTHKLSWGAYAELYVRPVQDLEWYFEMDVNNSGNSYTTPVSVPVYFETTTGITWYLPSFN